MGKFQPGQEKPPESGRKPGTPNKRGLNLALALDAVGINIPAHLKELLPQLSPSEEASQKKRSPKKLALETVYFRITNREFILQAKRL
jgi:hypothetical protein